MKFLKLIVGCHVRGHIFSLVLSPFLARYLPHHMRRQRAGRGEGEEGAELGEEEQGERLFLRAPRVVRRSEDFGDNPRLFRRVL